MAEFEGIRLQLFARRGGRNYMMRSEKRAGYNRPTSRKKPRKRRTRNGYLLLTLIVSILLWPLGLFLIWNRRLRCRAGGKALWSAATLIAFVGLCIAILTVPTGSPKLQAFQDRANDSIATLSADAKILWETASERSRDAFGNMRYFAETTDDFILNTAADGIEGGIALAQRAKGGVEALIARIGDFVEEALAPSPSPEPSAEPSAEATPAASASPKAGAPSATGAYATPGVTATPNPSTRPRATATTAATGTPGAIGAIGATATATPRPRATTTPGATASITIAAFSPSVAPGATPDDAVAVNAARAGLALARATQSAPTEAPTPTVKPTEKPTEAPTPTAKPTEKPTEAPTPTAKPTEKPTEAPTPTAKPTATPSPTPTASPTPSPTPTAKPTPTAAPTPSPTATPAPITKPTEVLTPSPIPTAVATPIPAQMSASGLGATLAIAPESTPGPALKPAGEFMVYHTARGKYYHLKEHCSGMLNASLHTLESSVEEGFKPCRTCHAPAADLLSQPDILWADEAKAYHLTDACTQFSGKPSLIALSEATEKAYTPCPVCGAAAYRAAT